MVAGGRCFAARHPLHEKTGRASRSRRGRSSRRASADARHRPQVLRGFASDTGLYLDAAGYPKDRAARRCNRGRRPRRASETDTPRPPENAGRGAGVARAAAAGPRRIRLCTAPRSRRDAARDEAGAMAPKTVPCRGGADGAKGADSVLARDSRACAAISACRPGGVCWAASSDHRLDRPRAMRAGRPAGPRQAAWATDRGDTAAQPSIEKRGREPRAGGGRKPAGRTAPPSPRRRDASTRTDGGCRQCRSCRDGTRRRALPLARRAS